MTNQPNDTAPMTAENKITELIKAERAKIFDRINKESEGKQVAGGARLRLTDREWLEVCQNVVSAYRRSLAEGAGLPPFDYDEIAARIPNSILNDKAAGAFWMLEKALSAVEKMGKQHEDEMIAFVKWRLSGNGMDWYPIQGDVNGEWFESLPPTDENEFGGTGRTAKSFAELLSVFRQEKEKGGKG